MTCLAGVHITLIVQRETELSYDVTTKLEFNPYFHGQEAGLVRYSGIYTYIKFCKCFEYGVVKFKVIENRNDEIRLLGEMNAPSNASSVYLRIVVRKQQCQFFVSEQGDDWTLVATEPDCTFYVQRKYQNRQASHRYYGGVLCT